MTDRTAKLEAWYRRIEDLRLICARNPAQLTETLDLVLAELSDGYEYLLDADEALTGQQEQIATAGFQMGAQNRQVVELFDLLPDGYLMTNVDGVIGAANRSAGRLLKVGADLLSGKALSSFIHSSTSEAFADLCRRVREAGRVDEWELKLQPRGHPPFDCAVSVAAIRDGQERGQAWHWLLRDITRRKQGQSIALRHSHQMELLHLIDGAIVGADRALDIAQIAADGLRRLAGCTQVAVAVFETARNEGHWIAVSSANARLIFSGRGAAWHGFQLPPELLRSAPIAYPDLAAIATRNEMARLLLENGLRSCLSVPIVSNERVVGSVNLGQSESADFGRDLAEMAGQVADSLAVGLENRRLLAEVQTQSSELQRLSRRLVEAQEDERRGVVRQLHDDSNQMMAVLLLELGRLDRTEGLPEGARDQLRRLRALADDIVSGLHSMAVNLRPAALDRLGLLPALEQYVEVFEREKGLRVILVPIRLDGRRFPPEVETALFRIVQEALSNSARHAQAHQVSVIVEPRTARVDGSDAEVRESVVVIVEDDGVGFDLKATMESGAPGLIGMRERAEMLGGRVTVESVAGSGTAVYAEVPV